jgi:hypothetical protein
MQERQPGCICELSEQGEPLVANYGECPVHKSDAVTPKKTASDLFEKISFEMIPDGLSVRTPSVINKSKQMCLIVVDEILNVLDTFQRHEYAKVLIPFYTEVKNEISKI